MNLMYVCDRTQHCVLNTSYDIEQIPSKVAKNSILYVGVGTRSVPYLGCCDHLCAMMDSQMRRMVFDTDARWTQAKIL